MRKRNKKTEAIVAQETEVAIVAQETEIEKAEAIVAEANVEINDEVVEQDIRRAKSVVPSRYKAKYAIAAVNRGETTRAAKRCNGDWLAQELAAECVPDGKTFDFNRFVAILEANGIEPSRWPNRSNGWQGRLRMSGAIVLRGIVRKTGILVTPDTTIEAPESFTAQG
jgi:hypothetical protein